MRSSSRLCRLAELRPVGAYARGIHTFFDRSANVSVARDGSVRSISTRDYMRAVLKLDIHSNQPQLQLKSALERMLKRSKNFLGR